jgi:uncharacterized phage protein (TIGR01671 family)
MSRVIKFRAWDSETNTVTPDATIPELVTRAVEHGRSIVAWEKLELMQYTGLKDKNGVEIYEGDVVKAKGFEPEIYEVVFDRGGFCLKNGDAWDNPDIKYVEEEHGEVIGNIYQHPELLTNRI